MKHHFDHSVHCEYMYILEAPKRDPSGPEGTASTPQATDQRLATRSHRPKAAYIGPLF
jgi:hypothetical protein